MAFGFSPCEPAAEAFGMGLGLLDVGLQGADSGEQGRATGLADRGGSLKGRMRGPLFLGLGPRGSLNRNLGIAAPAFAGEVGALGAGTAWP